MKKVYTLIFLSICVLPAYAQSTFQKKFPGGAVVSFVNLTKTTDGGYALAGSTQAYGAGNDDVFVVRTDSDGSVLWAKTYGGTGKDDAGAITQTRDGGFIIAGTSASFGDVGDVYLIRTDASGNPLWTKTYGQNNTYEIGYSVVQTTDGGFMVVGMFGGSGYDYMFKTDSTGYQQWANVYNQGTPQSVLQTANKGFLVCGTVYTSFGQGDDLFIYQTDSVGSVQWFRTYGGPFAEYGQQVIKANDGGYIAIGYTHGFGSSPRGDSIYVVKTDTSGNLTWSKTYASANAQYNEGSSITSTGNGYALMARTSLNPSDFYPMLINIDDTGKVTHANNYTIAGNIGTTGSVLQANDGGFIFTAYKTDNFLIKTDSHGSSGCNDSVNNFIYMLIPPTHVDSEVATLQSFTTVSIPPNTLVSSGSAVTTICSSTGVKKEAPISSTLVVYPNPCSQCQINGVDNVHDLLITDITGRKITATFTRTTNGYTMNLPESCSGIYIVRNIKTGAVAKVVKQ